MRSTSTTASIIENSIISRTLAATTGGEVARRWGSLFSRRIA